MFLRKKIYRALLVAVVLSCTAEGKAQTSYQLYGQIKDEVTSQGIDFAQIEIPQFQLVTSTDLNGNYRLNGVPKGRVRVVVSYVGKVNVDTILTIEQDQKLDLQLQDEDFRLNEVVVTARTSNTGKSTCSVISRNAIDHLQANSLADVMSLLPGAISTNPDLNHAKYIHLRAVPGGSDVAMKSLGTAIIVDGAPLSNNANLSSLGTTNDGESGTVSGGASPVTGIDVRKLSTDHIESIEVIRGIPSVEYGDLTSGAVVVHHKEGSEPLRFNHKSNPNVYEGNIVGGFDLGGNAGTLNLSGGYAYNTNDVTASYVTYQRLDVKGLWSRLLWNNRMKTQTSLSFVYGKDGRKENPDDTDFKTKSRGEEYGITLNTNGRIQWDGCWLRNIKYVFSGTYTTKQSYYQTIYTSGNAPYSGTLVDGITVSNFPGRHVYDQEGEEVTHFADADSLSFANYLPSTYVGHYSIDSREVNLFGKVTANFFKNVGAINNGLLIGIDCRSDGNEGRGSQWDVLTPPLRNVANPDASYRPRSYKEIPYIHTLGLFGEYNFQYTLGQRTLDLQLGLRYDRTSVAGGLMTPRINGSVDILPELLRVHGGWGVAAKMPSLHYLYPQKAYFEYINYNDLAYDWIPEDERMIITTTKVVDAQNKDIKIARNEKLEAGIGLSLGKMEMDITAFEEKLKDGYGMSPKYASFVYEEYDLDEEDNLTHYGTYPILSEYYSPSNSFSSNTRGVEFEVNVAQLDVIHTGFQFNGQWIRTDTKNKLPLYYDPSGAEPYLREDIGIYSADRMEGHEQQFVTSLRAVHNIPRIGFVVSLTMQTVWNASDWVTFKNDSIPVGYLSLEDGEVHKFSPAFTSRQEVEDAGYGSLLRNVNHASAIKESYRPYFQFNFNLTKEIGDKARISFFANNLFRSYPRRESKRNPGVYYTLNSPFYFGMELSLKLKK